MKYAAFYESILDAIDAEPVQQLLPAAAKPDVRPLAFKLGCIADAIVRSGLADLGQRELLRVVAERCWALARESRPSGDADTLAFCGELIGYMSTVESARLPIALPEAMLAFAEDLRLAVVGLASRAAFAQATAPPRGRFSRARLLLDAG